MKITQQSHRRAARSFLSKTVGRPGRSAVRQGITLLPVAAAQFIRAVSRGRFADAFAPIVGMGLGLVAWLVILISTQAAVNGALYPLLDAHDYENSWGGPTLAGAWAVHAALALPIVLAAVWVLRGLVVLGSQGQESSTGARSHRWSKPLALVVAAAGAVLFVGWVNQL
ncbi:hypothetical protein FBY35_4023 [Streptomyces sp. SLBN-118]|uniref:hypothetical protein n=1 Tax=Streptomyces sp. SLBN-118 TaxID=2768454 RepID=UPI0011538EA7|nr:hypothetical protein [Streptomyces sp. SLBN-118]TQK42595.1 hypothetical protein FBY35_4023 [Streptomyces sp. SLBN-118]